MAAETAELVVSNAPRKCELAKSLRQIDTIAANVCKKAKSFDIQAFRGEIKEFMSKNNIQDEKFTEKDELVNLILASNSKFEKLIADIESDVEKFILLKFQQIVKDKLKNSSCTYEQTINKIDQVLQTVGDYQANKTESEQVKYIEIDRILQKNELFKFTIDQVIVSRPDRMFIEFIPSKDVQPLIYSENVQNGLIDISENSISGTAPSKNGEYNYDVFIKVVFVMDKAETTIHMPFTIFVGNKNLQNSMIVTPENYNDEQAYYQNLVRLLIFIISMLIILLIIKIICRIIKCKALATSKNAKDNIEMNCDKSKDVENISEDASTMDCSTDTLQSC